MDGTPFGRPMITTRPAPDRPRLSIPPKKRIKTGCDADHSTLVQVGSDDGDESDDESYKESDEEQEVSEVGDDDEEVVGADMGAEIEAYVESDEAEESEEEEEDGIDEADFEELSRDYENPLMDYFDSDEVATSQVASSEQPSRLKAICGARDTQSLQGQNGSLQGDSSEDDDDYADSESSQDNDSSDGGDDFGDAVSSDEESMEADIVRQAGDLLLPDYFYSDASAAGGTIDSPKLPQIYQSGGLSGGVGGDERESESELLSLSGSSMFTGPEQDEDSRSSSEDPSDSSDSEESGESEKVVVPKDERSSKKAR